ncbi:hypothetical protein cym2001_25900 [Pseudomonas sp. CYM-20-01]|nr:hypothetical protein cym2001_25900 [Pseudomonas sp. CYM-20-01]
MVAAIHNVTLVRQRMEAKPRRNSIIGLINPEPPFKWPYSGQDYTNNTLAPNGLGAQRVG